MINRQDAHPDRVYFGVGKIAIDQVEDYPILNY